MKVTVFIIIIIIILILVQVESHSLYLLLKIFWLGSHPPPSINGNLFNTSNVFIPPPTDDFNIKVNKASPTIWKKGIGNNLFGSQAIMKGPREIEKTETQKDIDDFLYELPEKKMPELELGDGLLNSLGTSANTIFDDSIPIQKEEEEEILKVLSIENLLLFCYLVSF